MQMYFSMATAIPPIRVVCEHTAYGARWGVLECAGARVAVVLRRGALAAVAPFPSVSSVQGEASGGLRAILDVLRTVPSLTPSEA